jgi:hypothetical protein
MSKSLPMPQKDVESFMHQQEGQQIFGLGIREIVAEMNDSFFNATA